MPITAPFIYAIDARPDDDEKPVLTLLPAGFAGIHRGHAINVRCLAGTLPGPSRRVAKLFDGVVLTVRRTYAAKYTH